MAILVTGGAGYIGSVFVELLRARGETAVVLDDLSRGHRAAVDREVPFYRGRTGDRELVRRIVKREGVQACVHFAAFALVGESVAEPSKYFENNFSEAAGLFAALLENGVRRVVFSSTCATYGEVKETPIPETHPQWPVNPYGWSKFFVERCLESLDRAHGLRFAALRYFNAAGATARKGEDHEPETHLIPNVIRAALGKLPRVSIFGDDYPTPDGTAVRDYIHVADLGAAHIRALEYLRDGGASDCFNLGNGQGYSVLQVLETVRKMCRRNFETRREARRPGDPPRLIADAGKARRVLAWKPERPGLEEIVRSAWDWHAAHPDGYAEPRRAVRRPARAAERRGKR